MCQNKKPWSERIRGQYFNFGRIWIMGIIITELAGKCESKIATKQESCVCCQAVQEMESANAIILPGAQYVEFEVFRKYKTEREKPIIPERLCNERTRRIDPADFREAVLPNPTVCLGCYEKLWEIFHHPRASFSMGYCYPNRGPVEVELSYRFNFNSYSKNSYKCAGCNEDIKEPTEYWRLGHYVPVCIRCHERFVPILG